MALKYGVLDSHRVNVGNLGLTDPTICTLMTVVYPTAVGTVTRYFVSKNHDPTTNQGLCALAQSATGAGRIRAVIGYATTAAQAVSPDNTIELNVWQWLAATFDGTNAPKIYKATLYRPFAEVSSYVISTAPVGARTTDAGGAAFLGNVNVTTPNASFVGFQTHAWFINGVALNLGQLHDLYLRPRWPAYATSGGYWRPGTNGTGPVWDESGNKNHGTITGAIPTSDRMPRAGRRKAA